MASFSWEYDAASGVYKNHAMSKKIRTQAIVDCVIAQFARRESGFGKKSGENVTITKFKNLTVPTTATLNEHTRIPIDTFEMATSSITVAEWGRAVEHTNLSNLLSEFDLENPIQKALKDQMTVYTDNAAATALDAAYVCAIPTAASTITWDTDGTASTSATVNLNAALCGVIRDYMRDTLIVPWYEKSRYMCIASTKALRGIKSDGEFQAWRQYLQPQDVLYNSEVGDIEQIRFIESNNTTALSNSAGTGSVLGEAFIFGDDALALVEAQTPEIRLAIPGDFGRVQAAAWYGVLAFGLPWAATATAGEAKVVRLTSS
jgi:N4-gp56 family major capsid protein